MHARAWGPHAVTACRMGSHAAWVQVFHSCIARIGGDPFGGEASKRLTLSAQGSRVRSLGNWHLMEVYCG